MDRASPKAPKSAAPRTTKTPTATKDKAGNSARPKKPAAKPAAKRKTNPQVETTPSTNTLPCGRVVGYDVRAAQVVLDAIADGMSLRTACALPGAAGKSTFMRWLADDEHVELRDHYVRAREAQADTFAEEILQIADDGRNDTYVDDEGQVKVDHDVIARSRLRVDARKWLASKMAPKKYGDKITQEHTGAGGAALQVASTVTFVHPPARADDE